MTARRKAHDESRKVTRAVTPALLLCVSLAGARLLGVAPQRQTAADAISTLEKAVADRPNDVESWRRLAAAYSVAGRRAEAIGGWRRVTELAPRVAAAWYGLAQAYNDLKQDALASFDGLSDEPWRQLLAADTLDEHGQIVDAFALYRGALERLPSMVTIHESIARIYERTGHAPWAAQERAVALPSPVDCGVRRAMCEFKAGRYGSALDATTAHSDPESRYWRARAANELAVATFARLDELPDSRERRAVRATLARTEERYTDAIAELKAALALAPGDPALTYELATAYYAARDYDRALVTLSGLLQAHPDDPRLLRIAGQSLLQLRRLDEAVPLLRRAVARDPSDVVVRLALGRALLQNGDYASAIPLIEPQLRDDVDGSLHVQLGRAYAGIGQRDKAAALLSRSEELRRAAAAAGTAAAQRTITPPK